MTYPNRRWLLQAVIVVATAAGCARGPAPDLPPRSVVFFDRNSAALDEASLDAIRTVSATAARYPGETVIVAGFADQVGSPAANRTLSLLRAQVVADALASNGVDRGRIVVRPRGPTDADPGVESRRVEVRVGR